MQTGTVCVSPYLPFGGRCNILQAAGLTTPRSRWLHEQSLLPTCRALLASHDSALHPTLVEL